MSKQKTVTFTVPFLVIEEGTGLEVQKWLAPDGTLTTDRAMAAKFTVGTAANMAQRHRIDVRVHELHGGLEEYLEIQRAHSRGHRAVLNRIVSELWPNGRPELKGAEHMEQMKTIDAAWDADDSIEREGVTTMGTMIRKVEFIAAWSVLAVDVPPGWEDLAERTDHDAVFYKLWSSYDAAVRASTEKKT
jgi:hypothetical protein